MNKIVRKHYPASRLPDDLRGDLPRDAFVHIEVEVETSAPRALAEVVGTGENVHGDPEAVLRHVRSLRADR